MRARFGEMFSDAGGVSHVRRRVSADQRATLAPASR